MKRIVLKLLILENFKGIKYLSMPMDQAVNFIHGANGTGKTTLVDAFRWLLFDKDSHDRADFNIKTLDASGEAIHNLEHSVSAEISVVGKDGLAEIKTLKKTYKEKWTKKRGENQETFSGHETIFSLNDLPLKKSDFQDEISKIIDEDLFKMITDPFYFASVIKWQDRRKTLIDIAGDVTNADVLKSKPELSELHFDFDDISKQKAALAAKRKRINDEIKAIPVRIDEAYKSIRTDLDFPKIEHDIYMLNDELTSIEEAINKPYKPNPEIEKLQKRSTELQRIIRDNEKSFEEAQTVKIRSAVKLADSIQDKIFEKQGQQRNLDRLKIKLNEDIEYYSKDLIRLREEYDKKQMESARSLSDAEMSCPTCKRSFPENEIAEKRDKLIQDFNQDKAKKLAELNSKGKYAKEIVDKATKELEQVTHDYHSLRKEIEVLTSDLTEQNAVIEQLEHEALEYPKEHYDAIEENQAIFTKLDDLEKRDSDSRDLQGLKFKKGEIVSKIDSLKSQLNYKQSNEVQKARVDELKALEKKLSKEMLEVEQQQVLADEFTRTQANLLDQKINSMFKNVRFKLFDEQVNGGVAEVCEATVNGVPFKDANTGSKYNAGIDIINTLTEFYGVHAPIWLDNREAVTEIIPTYSQIINLVVDPTYDSLFNKNTFDANKHMKQTAKIYSNVNN